MQAAKEKVSDVASEAKAKMKIVKAKADEKAEKAAARTTLGKEIAHQHAKAEEAHAKMELHQEKADHRVKRTEHVLFGGQHQHVHQPISAGTAVPTYPTAGGVAPVAGTTGTTYPAPTQPGTGKYL